MTETAKATSSFLTQEAYDRLQAELSQLSGPGRTEIAKRIEAARDEGDLKENGGYHAAREEQGKLEARIVQVEDMLRRAKVGETPDDDGTVRPGMKVTIRFAGDDDTETFLFGAHEMAGGSDIDVYSPQSAMGVAINEAKKGDTVTYTAPNGKELAVEIVDATPYSS